MAETNYTFAKSCRQTRADGVVESINVGIAAMTAARWTRNET